MASFAYNAAAEDLRSADNHHKMMSINTYTRNDHRLVFLSEVLETALSNILRHGYDIERNNVPPATAQSIKQQILKWAQHIATDIPGYNDWDAIYNFTVDALYDPSAVPGEDPTPIGTEKELYDGHLDPEMKRLYVLDNELTEREKLTDRTASLATARLRLDILDQIPRRYTANVPMPASLANLFRKIRYAYKLRETLLSRIGYRAGSFQLAAGMPNNLDFCMLLIDMKMRRPDRMLAFPAPKPYACYFTYPDGEMPWNNQFSFASGFDEFEPLEIPRVGVTLIERRLVATLRQDIENRKWEQLCNLMSWGSQDEQPLAERSRIQAGFIPVERTGKQ